MKYDKTAGFLLQRTSPELARIYTEYYSWRDFCPLYINRDSCDTKSNRPSLVKRAGQIRESNKANSQPVQEGSGKIKKRSRQIFARESRPKTNH